MIAFQGIDRGTIVVSTNTPKNAHEVIFDKYVQRGGGFLIAMHHPFVHHYVYMNDTQDAGGINLELRVRVGDEVLKQKWRGLWSSSPQAVSAFLKKHNIFPDDLVSAMCGFETTTLFKAAAEAILPPWSRYVKDEIGQWKLVGSKPIVVPVAAVAEKG